MEKKEGEFRKFCVPLEEKKQANADQFSDGGGLVRGLGRVHGPSLGSVLRDTARHGSGRGFFLCSHVLGFLIFRDGWAFRVGLSGLLNVVALCGCKTLLQCRSVCLLAS